MKITQFGNPILREVARELTDDETRSPKTQQLISDMRAILVDKKLGIGLAAPQVGESIRLAVIEIQPTAVRPELEPQSLVIINPEITKTFGSRKQLWEGCISSGAGKAALFAKVPRYRQVKLAYTDENGKSHTKEFEGLAAHVIQHEVDHLNGILFVDKVKDTSTYMTYSEYKKNIRKKH